jgi:hypothetical protein
MKIFKNDIIRTRDYFHEKGIKFEVDDRFFSLKKEDNGNKSELTEICEMGLIYEDIKLVCYKGIKEERLSLTQLKERDLIFDDTSVYFEILEGKNIYMFWDEGSSFWHFSDDNRINSPYETMLKKNLYNNLEFEPFFTYCFKLVEKGENAGIYLDSMYDTTKGKEIDWKTVDQYAVRFKVKTPKRFAFDGFKEIEESDLPVGIKDRNGRRFFITSL